MKEIEKCEASFIDSSLITQPETIYRLKKGKERFYYTFDKAGEPSFYVSVTTMIKQTLPTSPFLIKWIADMGEEQAKEYAAERAHYGTFMHIEIAELLMYDNYDLEKMGDKLKAYILENNLPIKSMEWLETLKKDIVAFAQFIIDYEVEPIAIEIMLTNKANGTAGAIDLGCNITIQETGFFGEVLKTGKNAGKPKESKQSRRVRAIIDFKSGRKGFHPDSEIQLHAYKEMWEENFPELPIEKIYNWSPKDWTKNPGYNFKDQTNSKNAQKLKHLIPLAAIENSNVEDSTNTTVGGTISIEEGLAKNVQSISMSEIVKQAREEAEKKAKAENELNDFDEVMEGKS